jgi:hypothetical protein
MAQPEQQTDRDGPLKRARPPLAEGTVGSVPHCGCDHACLSPSEQRCRQLPRSPRVARDGRRTLPSSGQPVFVALGGGVPNDPAVLTEVRSTGAIADAVMPYVLMWSARSRSPLGRRCDGRECHGSQRRWSRRACRSCGGASRSAYESSREWLGSAAHRPGWALTSDGALGRVRDQAPILAPLRDPAAFGQILPEERRAV